MTRVGVVLIGAVQAVLLIAGVAKAADMAGFERVLVDSGVPSRAAPSVAITLIVGEIGIALLWFFRLATAASVWLAATALLGFSIWLAAQILIGRDVSCGCFGVWQAAMEAESRAESALLRNLCLMLILAVGTILSRRYPRHGGSQASVRGCAAPSRHAFTLPEILVVVLTIGVLLAILLPQIAGVRRKGHDAVSLANLRQHMAVFAAYTADWRDAYPHPFAPRGDEFPVPGTQGMRVQYFVTHAVWNYMLADQYYDGNPHNDAFYHPAVPETRGGVTTYYYACTFIARPEFWNPTTRTGMSQWGTNYVADVVYPSAKAVFVSVRPMFDELPDPAYPVPGLSTDLGFADGAASSVSLERIRPGVHSGDGSLPGAFHRVDFPWGMHTLDGVRGRDVP